MKNSLKIAFCGIATAISVVLMLFGGIIVLLAYIMPMLAGVLMLMVKKTFGTSAAWITYVSTSVLSFILVADRECMLMYVMFFGFYPIIKSTLEKIKSKPLEIILKLLIFNALMAVIQLVLVYVFLIPFDDGGVTAVFVLLYIVLLNLLFVTYNLLLNKIFLIYQQKIEPRLKKLLK